MGKSDSGVRLKYHCVVALVDGTSAPYVYVGRENTAHDPNCTIEVIQRVLKSEEAKRGSLPKTLYLQLDNCTRENKNIAVSCFVSWLLERGIFERIEVSYLPAGHTHNGAISARVAWLSASGGRVHSAWMISWQSFAGVSHQTPILRCSTPWPTWSEC